MHVRIKAVSFALVVLAIATFSACSERTALAPQSAAEPRGFKSISRNPDTELRGQVITTVRSLDGNLILGRLVQRDTAEYVALFRGTRPVGDFVRSASGGIATFDVVSRLRAAGRARSVESGTSRTVLKVRTVYPDNGPSEFSEITRGGEVLAQTRTEWEAIPDGFRIVRRTLTLFRGGRPSQSILLEYGEPARSVVDQSELGALRNAAVAGGERDPSDIESSMDGGSDGGDCNTQLDELDRAFGAYEVA